MNKCAQNRGRNLAGILVLAVLVFGSATAIAEQNEVAESDLTGKEMVERCGYKNAGKDQKSTFTVTLVDVGGNQKKSVYLRLWKDYRGNKGLLDKMMLFTEFPPDSKGGVFMRVAFLPESEKSADQWIYLPVLRKIRRVSIRDPGDKFLNSDLTYEDVSFRPVDFDEHVYIGMGESAGEMLYKVESTPKATSGLYSKRLLWVAKGGESDWDECVVRRISYYDNKGVLLKEQYLDWQKIGGAWMWDKVVVKNMQDPHESIFEMSDVRVDTGLSDRLFTKRAMKAGIDAVKR